VTIDHIRRNVRAILLANVFIAVNQFLTITPAISAAPAASPDAAADGAGAAGSIDDIVVTATRKETRLQSTPVAVSVIGEEFRRTQNVITTRDLAGQIPGLYTAP
jgi:iron complex outermembrane receptor protein